MSQGWEIAKIIAGPLTGAGIALTLKECLDWWRRPILTVTARGKTASQVDTPMRNENATLGQRDGNARYIRVYVENSGRSTAKGVHGYLWNFWKLERDNHKAWILKEDPITLLWSYEGESATVDLPPRIGRYLDVFWTDSFSSVLNIRSRQIPFKTKTARESGGVFGATIAVAAGSGDPTFIDLSVKWNERWDSLNYAD
jgi:hypothetical protein